VFGTKTRTERAAEAARVYAAKAQTASLAAQAAMLKDKVGPSAQQAAQQAAQAAQNAAQQARESASHAAEAAMEWATPRLEKARERQMATMTKAAPKVEHAAEALTPKVEHARDRIVDDVLPRIVEAVNAAAAAVAAKTDEAGDASVAGLKTIKKQAHEMQKAAKPKHRLRNLLLILGALGAAVGAGYMAWKRSQPTEDPWVTATGGAGTGTSSRLSGDTLSQASTDNPFTSGGGTGPGAGTLGTGSLASESTDVDTPTPDGLATGEEQLRDGGEVGMERGEGEEGSGRHAG
jgi:hypothetical protein